MELGAVLNTREDLLNSSKDDDGFVQQNLLIDEVMPLLLETKVVDSEDINHTYYLSNDDKIKINGYTVNSTGERLQIFIVDDSYLSESNDDFYVSNRNNYEEQFKKAIRLVSSAIQNKLENVQESEPIKPLIAKLGSEDGLTQFDVIEIFLVTLSATVSFRGEEPQLRTIHYKDDNKNFSHRVVGKKSQSKELLFIRRVVDLNYLANVYASQGRAEPLKVVFKDIIGKNIEVIKAADEVDFESYLCVLDAPILSDLYKRYSSQLLEKNVRSFLQFKGVNKGIKKTIKDDPEKFIAFNNGLTITATEAKTTYYKKSLYLESLEDFQIVNGGQTTASIYFSSKEGLDISNVKVVAKINIAKTSKSKDLDVLISNISEFSNSQSRVSKVDLRSRSPKLVQLKSLSESVLPPSGKKWFFERAKGDFNTQVRKSTNGQKLKKDFPPKKRFTKELLAKYYCAWGDAPHLVKKGGEKVFRMFIEDIEPEQGDGIDINREFYEQLIAKIILFRTMEEVYGQGNNAIGQLRSAAVPYTISAIYKWSHANNNGTFLLQKIWKQECLSDELIEHLKELLFLMNELIKKYSLSDDYGEYSKKEELWVAVKESSELKNFMALASTKAVLNI
ncbi:abortive phage infection protein [Enterovibrio norvegicus FF-454]|uniref:Abortive phage infection protein n=1 Tax=Enterovibrio norvegicus FF-454 TaxID=1185651 RepID=A0A1E5C2S8_9GAMM|nr:AIPR family protein [Enterovibrio norvegicus]OEE59827.1 abortive phage infection protein [Enterovibrio norvegicus FF-454]